IGYVSQDYSMLYGTVHENIALSMPWANDQMVVRAAQVAGVDKFVRQHPAGYAMPIGEQGAGVSGGQRQAIAIARAIISNPLILLLDEPTSSIDASTEQLITRNLAQYSVKRTLVVVTHKMSMLNLVERVIVLDKGKVIADGPKNKIVGKFAQQEIIIGENNDRK
ncbi:MAG: ATP-binding cassette domain-containing protein, partial [Gammaproteobacteria bacterium]|nr:ATP-binding cassette domain-containing protein [Gammaproteobacteria bacterium]